MAKLNHSAETIELAASQQGPVSWLRSSRIRTEALNDFVEQCIWVARVPSDDSLTLHFDEIAAQHVQVTRLILILQPAVVGQRAMNKLHQWEARCRGALKHGYVSRSLQGDEAGPVVLPDPVFATTLEALSHSG